jgi:hypothetical protein
MKWFRKFSGMRCFVTLLPLCLFGMAAAADDAAPVLQLKYLGASRLGAEVQGPGRADRSLLVLPRGCAVVDTPQGSVAADTAPLDGGSDPDRQRSHARAPSDTSGWRAVLDNA